MLSGWLRFAHRLGLGVGRHRVACAWLLGALELVWLLKDLLSCFAYGWSCTSHALILSTSRLSVISIDPPLQAVLWRYWIGMTTKSLISLKPRVWMITRREPCFWRFKMILSLQSGVILVDRINLRHLYYIFVHVHTRIRILENHAVFDMWTLLIYKGHIIDPLFRCHLIFGHALLSVNIVLVVL